MRRLILAITVVGAILNGSAAVAHDGPEDCKSKAIVIPLSSQNQVQLLETRITELETTLTALQTLVTNNVQQIATVDAAETAHGAAITSLENSKVMDLESYITVDETGDSRGPLVQFVGINLQLVNGAESTASTNGLGNLIIGYDELRGSGDNKTGSHNLVIGSLNNYSSYGGLIAGYFNSIGDIYAAVTGGRYNQALGDYSSVNGGRSNTAEGVGSSIIGGSYNFASGSNASINGGRRNAAIADYSAILGGSFNWTGDLTYDSEGYIVYGDNHSLGVYSTVSGGLRNSTSGNYSSVTGGSSLSATSDYSLANPYHP